MWWFAVQQVLTNDNLIREKEVADRFTFVMRNVSL